jgi:hypothetical protein
MPDLSQRSAIGQTISLAGDRVGPAFIVPYALAFMSTTLVLIAPLLVTSALKVNSLVGTAEAPTALSLVTGAGAVVAMLGSPVAGS